MRNVSKYGALTNTLELEWLGWVTTIKGRPWGRSSVTCGLESVTDRPYGRYRADTDGKMNLTFARPTTNCKADLDLVKPENNYSQR